MIKHIVLTKFQDPNEAAPEAAKRLLALQAQIPEIVSMETGLDFMGSARSYDLALIVTFKNKEDLAVYADHPAHAEVKKYIHAHRTGSVTVDFAF